MNRSILPNPLATEYSVMQLQLAQGLETPDWDKLGIRNPPAGYKSFVRYTDNVVTIGIEPVDAKAPKAADKYDAMNDAELRTQCGIKGIPYTAESRKTELVAALRSLAGAKK